MSLAAASCTSKSESSFMELLENWTRTSKEPSPSRKGPVAAFSHPTSIDELFSSEESKQQCFTYLTAVLVKFALQ